MYVLVYEQMVNSGVATKLSSEEEYCVGAAGNKKYDMTNEVGDKVKFYTSQPGWIIFGD